MRNSPKESKEETENSSHSEVTLPRRPLGPCFPVRSKEKEAQGHSTKLAERPTFSILSEKKYCCLLKVSANRS